VTNRRTTELGLMLLALIVTASVYVLVGLGSTASLPADLWPFLAVVGGLLMAGHLAVRILAPEADPTLLPLAALLNGLGYVFIARLDEDLAANQATWTMLGVAAFAVTLLITRDLDVLSRYRYTLAFVGLGLIVLPLVPGVGRTLNGARLWVSLGPVNFQPGEFAKVALALFFAAYLVDTRELLALGSWRVGPLHLPDPRHLAPVFVAWMGSLGVLIFQKDLGSSLLLFAAFIVMLWMATGRAWYLGLGGVLFCAGAFAAWTQFDHVRQRVEVWLDPWADPDASGFQLLQATFALAAGGITGTGPGQGQPNRIPLPETDFIFAVIGEELGLLGGTALLAAYLLFIGSGLRIASRAGGGFPSLVAVGLTTIVGVQAFIIIGGVLRVVPLTGITLPFVSFGGSSLLANYIIVAILLRISDHSARDRSLAAVTA
jgi:peptidoglycan glycosyltransferase